MRDSQVVIGIPSYKRAQGLRRLLDSIRLQKCEFKPIVVVADNEGISGDAHNVVAEMKSTYPFELLVIPVTERGISNVRNALMQFGFDQLKAEVLAMVDDDEIVDERWILELVSAQKNSSAEVVGGAIYPEFEIPPPEWTKKSPLYFRKIHPDGFIPLIQAAGNILIHRSIFTEENRIYFDPVFGLSGGEDKEFFTRLKKRGVRFYYCSRAKSYEYYGSERLNQDWALSRAHRIGSNDMRILMSTDSSKVVWLRAMFFASIGVLYYSIKQLLCYSDSSRNFLYKLKVYRQLGKLSGASGSVSESYK